MSANKMVSDSIPAHLCSREEALLDPEVRRDRIRVDELLSRDFVEFGSSGRIWSRDQILDLLGTEAYEPVRAEDFKCGMLSESVALITYRTIRMDVQTETEAVTLRSSIWKLENGEWKARFHQGTRVP